ncbi:MAG: VUT family protein [Aestuariivirga sp.]
MWTAAYVLSIVLVNWLFVAIPPLPTPFGALYLATLVVGAVFVLRDYAQREIGHKILLATLLAGIITWYMVDPGLAIASLTAFFISETADWAIYSFTKRPLQSRILVSSLVSVPLDTVAFLYLTGFLTPASFSTEVVSKAVGVMIVWMLLRAREQRAAGATA